MRLRRSHAHSNDRLSRLMDSIVLGIIVCHVQIYLAPFLFLFSWDGKHPRIRSFDELHRFLNRTMNVGWSAGRFSNDRIDIRRLGRCQRGERGTLRVCRGEGTCTSPIELGIGERLCIFQRCASRFASVCRLEIVFRPISPVVRKGRNTPGMRKEIVRRSENGKVPPIRTN